MKPISPFGLPIGISIVFWSIIGILRFVESRFFNKKTVSIRHTMKTSDVAVIIPAHNEELVVGATIRALKKIIDKKQIYVVSDGSSDKTYVKARMKGVNVEQLTPGRGKAKAMVYLINKFNLYKNYKLIFIVDADTIVDRYFMKRALPLFDEPDISVVFAVDHIKWPQHLLPRLKYYFIAYRERLTRILHMLLTYGQTWKFTNVNYVIPGYAALYRTDILKQLEIDTPGLLIEDFNLAFQLHKKKLGKIGYRPNIIAWDQHPDNLVDYWNQVRRWNIGFFQTVKKNGFWPSFFWLSLAVFTFEVLVNSIFIILLPLIIVSLVWPEIFTPFFLGYGPFQYLNLMYFFLFIYLFDYLITVIVGWINNKPQFAFYGLFFFPMHFINSLILISAIIPGFFGSSSGRWDSPTRREEKIS